MQNTVLGYIGRLKEVRNISDNTVDSYKSDLKKFLSFLQEQGITEDSKLSATNLNSYILYLERQGLSNATISHHIASVGGYCDYLFRQHILNEDITEFLKSPKVERKEPKKILTEDLNQLLIISGKNKPKVLRDQAMLEVLSGTEIQISELINLRVQDLKLELNYVICKTAARERSMPVSEAAKNALRKYLDEGRTALLKDQDSDILFPNTRGKIMSRQGFWKIVKSYAQSAHICENVTPNMVRRS